MGLLRTGCRLEHRLIDFGSAVQRLWLTEREVKFQIVGISQCRLPGRGAVEVGGGGQKS